jgi:hypothetical protein
VPAGFDPRIVQPDELAFLQACQRAVPFHLGGGAALAGVHLRHRLSADADLFLHTRDAHRELVRILPEIGLVNGTPVSIVRDAGSFVRGQLLTAAGALEIDVVFDAVPDLEPPPPPIDGVVVESLADLRANKLTCILSRSEPRDLVDLLFLDRAGFPPERDLTLASQGRGHRPGRSRVVAGSIPRGAAADHAGAAKRRSVACIQR